MDHHGHPAAAEQLRGDVEAEDQRQAGHHARIEQPSVSRPAEPAGQAGYPVCFGVRRSGNAQDGRRCIPLDVGCRSITFDADHQVGCELIITADLTTAKEAGAGASPLRREASPSIESGTKG